LREAINVFELEIVETEEPIESLHIMKPINIQQEQEVNGKVYKSSKRILIVDDEPYNILALIIIFKIALKDKAKQEIINLIVDKAHNGQEALDLVQSNYRKFGASYGLIFMDCSMPVMNGYEASIAIRQFCDDNFIS
jgi:CheY-like chemotaxis protein